MKIGLALGGGGARGFGHIGVLEVLEKEKIKINALSGTSMGAVIASLYSLYKDTEKAKEMMHELCEKRMLKDMEEQFNSAAAGENSKNQAFRKTFQIFKELYIWNMRVLKKNLVEPDAYTEIVRTLIGDHGFKDCQIPLQVVAVDLLKGEEEYISTGSLSSAVLASVALPGVFAPVRKGDSILIDGGILDPVPIRPLKKRNDFVLAVNIEPKMLTRRLKSSLDVLMSCDEIRLNRLVRASLEEADFLIEPDLSEYSWAAFSKIDEIIDKGREEAEKQLPYLRKALKKKRYFPFLKSKPYIKPVENVILLDEND